LPIENKILNLFWILSPIKQKIKNYKRENNKREALPFLSGRTNPPSLSLSPSSRPNQTLPPAKARTPFSQLQKRGAEKSSPPYLPIPQIPDKPNLLWKDPPFLGFHFHLQINKSYF
jgi:hypothetical protein